MQAWRKSQERLDRFQIKVNTTNLLPWQLIKVRNLQSNVYPTIPAQSLPPNWYPAALSFTSLHTHINLVSALPPQYWIQSCCCWCWFHFRSPYLCNSMFSPVPQSFQRSVYWWIDKMNSLPFFFARLFCLFISSPLLSSCSLCIKETVKRRFRAKRIRGSHRFCKGNTVISQFLYKVGRG